MKASQKCVEIVEECEGYSAAPYRCPAGVATIGFGTTHYEDGRAVSMDDPSITRDRAEELLLFEIQQKCEPVINHAVSVPLTQGQFDALADFAYNLGTGALRSSTLLRKLNAGDYAGAAAEFDKWTHADGKTLPGLVKRRALERALFEGK